MLEKFRSWKFRKLLNITYTDENGNKRKWSMNQELLKQKIVEIVTEYMHQNINLTNRQLYYQLFARGIIPNADEIYKRMCKFITDLRYAGLLDWSAIEDRGRVPTIHAEWDNVKSLISSAVSQYRLPRWENQEYYLELYCEKQAGESVLKPIADKYHIYFGYNKGYSSASTMYDLANRIKTQIQNGKKARILYFGDHDASGLDMIRDIRDRITEFLTNGDDYTEPNFEVVPMALTLSQIKKYNPPPNPAKITDPRAKWYLKEYGNKSWELDALKPEILRKLAEDGIFNYIDLEKYNACIKEEDRQKKALVDFGETYVGGEDE